MLSVRLSHQKKSFFNFMLKFLYSNKKYRHAISKRMINASMPKEVIRPVPLSTFSNTDAPSRKDHTNDYYNPILWDTNSYASWSSLTNKKFSNRLLGCASQAYYDSLPPVEDVKKMFLRDGKPMKPSEKTSTLFMSFAQWFTDGFFISDPHDLRKNRSSHQVDLCQIYGLDNKTTKILRKGEGGLLKTQKIKVVFDGKEVEKDFPPYLYERDLDNNLVIKKEFQELPYLKDLEGFYRHQWKDENRKSKMYATGIFRGNMTITHTAFNILFIRSHNKIAKQIQQEHNDWNDDRIFETARNVLISIFLSIVVEDYVAHLNPSILKLVLDNSYAEQQHWYRENWVSIEFNLLYRWHSLIPDKIKIASQYLNIEKDFHLNNTIVEQYDIGRILEDISFQQSGMLGTLYNVPDFMAPVEEMSINTARALRIKPYNDYREVFGLKKLTSFDELTDNEKVKTELKKLYGSIDSVEFYVGLFADEKTQVPGKLVKLFSDGMQPVMGALMYKMVAYEAYSQILTNPLLAKRIYLNEDIFSKIGVETVKNIGTLTDLMKFTEGERYMLNFQNLETETI